MKKFVFTGLRARILLLVTLAMIPWLATTLYHAGTQRQSMIAAEQERIFQIAHQVALDQRETIAHAHILLHALSTLPEVRQGAPDACRHRLSSMLDGDRHYTNIAVTDAKGILLCDALGTRKARNFSDRDWFRQAVTTRRAVIGNLVIGRITGKPALVAARPIFSSKGDVSRVVFAAIDIEWLQTRLEQLHLPQNMAVSIMDAKGVIVAQYPAKPEFRGTPSSLIQLTRSILTKQQEGIGHATGSDGIARVFAYRRVLDNLDSDSVYVSVIRPTDPLLAQSNRVLAREMAALGLTLALIFTLVWFSTNILVLRKMKALIRSAQEIAQGNFNVRTQLGEDRSELGELARVFDDMAESLELLFQQSQHIMEVTPEAIIVSDSSGKIVMVNRQTEKLFGYSRSELVGASIETLVPERLRANHPAHRNTYIGLDTAPIKEMGKGRELFARKKDGSEFPTEISLGPLKTKAGNFVICAVRDITERKLFEAQIQHQATHDALTGLPNRLLFHDILMHATAHARRTEKLLAVMFLDLDGFKNINDTLGHDYGDRLLKEIAQRLTTTLRGSDLVARDDDIIARQGGDEFTLLLQGVQIVENIIQIAERILAAVAVPFITDDHEMHVTASIGITVFPFDDTDIENLLQNADTAMYRAKESGKNNFQFYTAEMNALIRERMAIENGLRQALVRNEFVLHYQPQMDIKTGKMVGVEALVRWVHPEKGLISPAVFIPVAEESGLIVPLGEWVLRTACQQRKCWQDAGLPHVRMAVNLSARQFRDPHLAAMVAKILSDVELDPHSDHLELELTESLLMQNMERSLDTLHELHQMGVCLSIDDFGTGYSSLSYLKRFPIHTLKIDQSFIRDIVTEPKDAAVVATIVVLGHNLNLNVIAEGVETAEQLALVRDMQCDQVQGYYFSRPLPAEELEKLLREINA